MLKACELIVHSLKPERGMNVNRNGMEYSVCAWRFRNISTGKDHFRFLEESSTPT